VGLFTARSEKNTKIDVKCICTKELVEDEDEEMVEETERAGEGGQIFS
jgi:hypothetical protein